MDTPVTALLLCGGSSTRFGGGDKTRATVGGVPLLARLLHELPGSWPVVCVGEVRPLPREVTWTREDPPGGGPTAGLWAGLRAVTTPYVVVLAGDLPLAGRVAPDLVDALRADDDDVDGVQALDDAGEAQPLLAAYRTDALRGVVPAALDDARGLGVRRILRPLRLRGLPVARESTWDVDTLDDLDRVRHIVGP